jgi:hypothetical protein
LGNKDGFVGTGELWNVMPRLEMTEGAAQEDCRWMIAAHDDDDRISFPESRIESRIMWRTIDLINYSFLACSILFVTAFFPEDDGQAVSWIIHMIHHLSVTTRSKSFQIRKKCTNYEI